MGNREHKDRADELSWGTKTPGPLESDELWENAPGAEGRAEKRGGSHEDDMRRFDTSTLGGASASGDYGTGDYEDETGNTLGLAEDVWDDVDLEEEDSRARQLENQGGDQGRSAGDANQGAGTETGLNRDDHTDSGR
jgi:hypothetical protein